MRVNSYAYCTPITKAKQMSKLWTADRFVQRDKRRREWEVEQRERRRSSQGMPNGN